MDRLTLGMEHYGYPVLFLALMSELLALPLPGEVIMSYAGLLVFQGKLGWGLSILAAGAGASVGMTISYWLGRKLGLPFFRAYGSRIHLGPDKLERTSAWFETYGRKVLLIACFIPGVRHFTGYLSGINRMTFRAYMLYAYIGAFLWTGTFISLGYALGPKWNVYHHTIAKYMIIGGVTAAVATAGVSFYRKRKEQLKQRMLDDLRKAVVFFHSFGRVKVLIVVMSLLFLGFFTWTAGLIQDFLAGEFMQFDEVAAYLVHGIFGASWLPWMERFRMLGSAEVLIPVGVLTFVWIMIKGKDRLLETGFLIMTVPGGELLEEVLRHFFHRTGPAASGGFQPYSFPGEQTLMAVTVYGFAAFLLIRHQSFRVNSLFPLACVLAIALLAGLSAVYFDLMYPSDAAAGYAFGGVWVSLNIVLLEIFRQLKKGRLSLPA